MNKNVAGQFFFVDAYDEFSGEPVMGDAANITAQLAIDGGTSAAIAGATAEVDATNHPGLYRLPATQAETNGFQLAVTPSSSTPGVVMDRVIYNTTDAAAALADDVLDEQLADHNLAGTMGAKLNSIGALNITVQNPVGVSNDLTIVQGDDYQGARALVWTITGYAGPNLDGDTATIKFVKANDWAKGIGTTIHTTDPTSTIVQSGSTITITQPLTSAQTLVLSTAPPGDNWNYRYGITAVDAATTQVITLVSPDSRCKVLNPGD